MKPIYSCKTCKLCKKKIQVNHGIFLHFAADCLFDLKGNLHIWKNHRAYRRKEEVCIQIA